MSDPKPSFGHLSLPLFPTLGWPVFALFSYVAAHSAASFFRFYDLAVCGLSLKCAFGTPTHTMFSCLPFCARKSLHYAFQTCPFYTAHKPETLRACSRIHICIASGDNGRVTPTAISHCSKNFFVFQWERVTASRIATIYFIFSILNCVLQVVFQAQAFSINAQADHFLSGLISTGNLSLPTGFFVLDSKQLHFCDHVPRTYSTKTCQVVWDGEIVGTGNTTSTSQPDQEGGVTSPTPTTTISSVPTTTIVLTPTPTTTLAARALVQDVDTRTHRDKRFLPHPQLKVGGYHRTSSSGQASVRLTGLEINGEDITLDSNCLVNLEWPVQT